MSRTLDPLLMGTFYSFPYLGHISSLITTLYLTNAFPESRGSIYST
ncbi:hypothetical protein [Aeromonas phage Akh-2]|nr:hypothetical protein [Aeromonas phage Akh-2]